MLIFKDRGVAAACMEKHSGCLSSLFSKFAIWNGEDIPFSRIVELRISGVPFILRENSLFDKVGGLFGEVIEQSSFSWQVEDNSIGLVKVLSTRMSRIDEAAVVKWNNRSTAIWVSEGFGQGLLVEDKDSTECTSDSDSESESDTDGSEGTFDLEDGELREDMEYDEKLQNENYAPVLVSKKIPMNGLSESIPVEAERSVGGEGPQEVQETVIINDGGNRNNLHAEGSEAAHDDGNNEHYVENENILNVDRRLGNMNNGPRPAETSPCNIGPDVVNGDVGPTPGNNLGKRNRDERSPPSIGSVQGPAQRLFCHQSSNAVPLDLNTPASAVPNHLEQSGEEPGVGLPDPDHHGPELQEDYGSRPGGRDQEGGIPVG
ncbi:hypothetical protein Hanom_Chr02g00155261 [Helianthus anomalus]